MTDACHNCGQTELTFLYHAPAFDSGLDIAPQQLGLARCTSCSIVNTIGATTSEVADSYTNEYYGSGSRKFLPLIEWAVSLTCRIKAARITRTWRQNSSTNLLPSVLDIGCGRGNLLQAFRNKGASVLGLEREEFPENDRPESIVRAGAITDAEYADETFDIIILWHVLEHMEKPEALLEAITCHLNENGMLVIAVPNYSSLQQTIFSKYWFHLDLPRHLVHLEPQWLIQQLVNQGYSIRSVSYVDPLQSIYGFIQSAMNTLVPSNQNHYYRLLKHGQSHTSGSLIPMIKWSLLSLVLLPFAILEGLFGALFGSGATVEIAATPERKCDQ